MKNHFFKLVLISLFFIPVFVQAAATSIFVPTGGFDNAVLSISDANSSYFVNDEFTVQIILDTKGNFVEGVDIVYLNYDPSFLEVLDADSQTNGVQIKAGSLMPNTNANSVSGGKILFSQSSSGNNSYSGSGVLASINFKVLKEGTTSLTFDFTKGLTTDTNVAGSGKDILSSVENKTYVLKVSSGSNSSSSPSSSDSSSSDGLSGGGVINNSSDSPSSNSSSSNTTNKNTSSTSNEDSLNTISQNKNSDDTDKLREGELFKIGGDSKIYLIENGKRKHIPSAEEFNKRGFKWNDIKTVSSDILDKYPEESYEAVGISKKSSSHILLRTPEDSKIYLIENGKRKHIPSAEEFNKRGFKWNDIKTVSSATLNQYPEEDYYSGNSLASDSSFTSLVKFSDSPKVYVVFGSKKEIVHIPTYEAFVSAGFDFSQVKYKDAKERKNYKVLLLVKGKSPEVYFLDPNKRVRKHIASPEVFNSYAQNRWEDIAVIPEKYLNMYKDVKLIQVEGDPTVYFLDGKVKRRIPSLAVFNENGFEWQDVMKVNRFEMNFYLTGKPLTGNLASL